MEQELNFGPAMNFVLTVVRLVLPVLGRQLVGLCQRLQETAVVAANATVGDYSDEVNRRGFRLKVWIVDLVLGTLLVFNVTLWLWVRGVF
jgi:hypothetical protein